MRKSTVGIVIYKMSGKRHDIMDTFDRDDCMNLLTTKQVAEIIEKKTKKPITIRQVQREIESGYIKAEKIAGTYFIKREDLKGYKRRHPGISVKK